MSKKNAKKVHENKYANKKNKQIKISAKTEERAKQAKKKLRQESMNRQFEDFLDDVN